MKTIKLECECGKVTGSASVRPDNARIACCCDDCQAWASWLRDDLLDEFGGTDLYQMPHSNLKIESGHEFLGCGRLTEKGLFRFYTTCCRTPIGNTVSAKLPFVGVPVAFVKDDAFDQEVGDIECYVHIKYAKKQIPADLNPKGLPLKFMAKTMKNLMSWKLGGLSKPTPLFENGVPAATPKVVS